MTKGSEPSKVVLPGNPVPRRRGLFVGERRVLPPWPGEGKVRCHRKPGLYVPYYAVLLFGGGHRFGSGLVEGSAHFGVLVSQIVSFPISGADNALLYQAIGGMGTGDLYNLHGDLFGEDESPTFKP